LNATLDAEYWNTRYVNNDAAWDTNGITTPLKAYFDQLENKNLKILIPGAGNAYEAEYLVNKGFTNVFVCDLAPAPLQNLKNRCPNFKDDQLLLCDFFEYDKMRFDLIVEQTFFCALNPNLRQKYFEKVHQLLEPNGKLVGLLFDDVLNTDKPPFGGNKEEYESYFTKHFKKKIYETSYNSIKPREGRELFINLVKLNQ